MPGFAVRLQSEPGALLRCTSVEAVNRGSCRSRVQVPTFVVPSLHFTSRCAFCVPVAKSSTDGITNPWLMSYASCEWVGPVGGLRVGLRTPVLTAAVTYVKYCDSG